MFKTATNKVKANMLSGRIIQKILDSTKVQIVGKGIHNIS